MKVSFKDDELKRYFQSFQYYDLLHLKDIFTIGITGTNGKTSTCMYLFYFLRKYYQDVLFIGTHKVLFNDIEVLTNNTTLEIKQLYEIISTYKIKPKIIIMEISSHGINYARINCFDYNIIALTNISKDHLDFHLNEKNYINVKQSIFNKKDAYKLVPIKYKKEIKNCKYYSLKESLFEGFDNLKYDLNNLYLTYLILIKLRFNKKIILKELKKIKLQNGRGEIIYFKNRKIIIDYAHTVESFIEILNNSDKKITVFGCGGNRDKSKRKEMGCIALKYSTHVIVTKDNSRSEPVDSIINDITQDNKDFIVIKDRYKAIQEAIEHYKEDVYILGKGEERFINENNRFIPFNDKECVLEIINHYKQT